MSLQDDLRAPRSGPLPPRRPRRWDLFAAWAVILAPLLGLAIFFGVRQRVGDLEERLVRDANATFSRPLVRPVHVDAPTPGTFGEAVARHLPPIQRWADSVKDDAGARDVAREIVAGKRPLGELPPVYAAALAGLGPHLDGLLVGTHAERADLPLAKEPWRPCDGADWSALQAAGLLAGLRLRRALDAGDAVGAVATCLDGIALARDAALAGGLVGHMTGVAKVKRLFVPCHAALDRLEAAERADAVRRLRTIRDAFPSVHEMLRIEFLTTELFVMGNALAPSTRGRLVPRAAAASVGEGPYEGWRRYGLRDAWRSLRATQDATLRAAESASGDELVERMNAIGMEATGRLNPLAAIAMPNYGRYVHRAEWAVSGLDALAIAAAARDWRERVGRWPSDVDELLAGGAISDREAARSGVTLTPAAGGTLRLELALPSVDGKEPPEQLALVVSPGRRAVWKRPR